MIAEGSFSFWTFFSISGNICLNSLLEICKQLNIFQVILLFVCLCYIILYECTLCGGQPGDSKIIRI